MIDAKTAGRSPDPADLAWHSRRDLAVEISWLCRVARAYATSPIVPLLGDRSAR